MFINTFSPRKSCRLWHNVEKCYISRQATDDNIIRRMRCPCCVAKATHTLTHTHSQYITLIAFPLQQWLRERARNFRYTYIARLVVLHLILLSLTLLQTCILLSSIPHFLSSSLCFLAYIYLHFRLIIIFLLNFLQLRPVGHAPSARQQDVIVEKMDRRCRWKYNIKTLAVPWLGRLVASFSSRKPVFKPGQVHLGFLADWVALGPVSLGVLPFSSVRCIPEMLHWLCVHISPLLYIFCNWQFNAITYFVFGITARSGPGSPHSRGF